MTHAEHTPGPWSHHDLRGDRTKFSIVHNGPIAYVGDNTAGPDNCEANARLIAAAPDLLAALVAAEETLGGNLQWITDLADLHIRQADSEALLRLKQLNDGWLALVGAIGKATAPAATPRTATGGT